MTDSQSTSDGVSQQELPEWYVTIRAAQMHHDPDEFEWEQYTVQAEDSDEAREKGIEKAKNHFSRGIIDRKTDVWDVVEVSGPHE